MVAEGSWRAANWGRCTPHCQGGEAVQGGVAAGRLLPGSRGANPRGSHRTSCTPRSGPLATLCPLAAPQEAAGPELGLVATTLLLLSLGLGNPGSSEAEGLVLTYKVYIQGRVYKVYMRRVLHTRYI